MGYTDPAVRQDILLQEGAMLTAKALRDGRNPAEVIHQVSEFLGFSSRTA
jgi:hypothetical protein